MISTGDVAAYVVNLKRRRDRREWMEGIIPPELPVTFTSDWDESFDGQDLDLARLQAEGRGLFPWRIESDNPWWSRPLKLGEIGCTLAHLACWQHAAAAGEQPFVLVLEDDAALASGFLAALLAGLRRLADHRCTFDLLYLGRYALEPDRPAVTGFVSPGYSHCTYGYLLTRAALEAVLATRLDQAIIPVDEFLPALYIEHPRADVRARFPRQLTALAFAPPLVRQLPKQQAGSDTEDSAFVHGP
jgi:GR25 family glycosyltransferase involved in LPS biosynthesis